MATHTKIRVAIATRKALRAIGRKGESYDDIILFLKKFRDVVQKNDPSFSDEAVRRMMEEVRD